MRLNHLRQNLVGGGIGYGCAIQQYASPEIPRLLSAAGFEFFFVDMEHGPFDLDSAHMLVTAGVGAEITPLIRVGELLYSLVTRALDTGAQGVIFPRVERREELVEAVSWTRYPPVGKRGFGVLPPQLNYQQEEIARIISCLNASTLVIAQLETGESIENCDELISVPGLDIALIGPVDLSISLGVPGEFHHPLMVDGIDRVVESCNRNGVIPGIHCRSVDLARFWIDRGMRFIGCGSEQSFMFGSAKETAEALKAMGAARSPFETIGVSIK